jgi:hypothetical protein
LTHLDSTTKMPVPFGVSAKTGLGRPGIRQADLALLSADAEDTKEPERGARLRDAQPPHYGVTGEIRDPNDLRQTGWGLIFAKSTDSAIRDALKSLLNHREGQVADSELFKVFEGAEGYKNGDTARSWLDDRGGSFGPVEPYKGVPYYLLIVGSPQEIPFEFQYTLDIYYAVGRLHFDTPDEYRRYAGAVVHYERSHSRVHHTRQTVIFAPEHSFEISTPQDPEAGAPSLFVKFLADALSNAQSRRGVVGRNQNFKLQTFIGEAATKETLRNILCGKIADGAPAVVLSGSHGVESEQNDRWERDEQGAIVCKDWKGGLPFGKGDYFGANDVPKDATVDGLIYFLFACYGGGYSRLDSFCPSESRIIASQPGIPGFLNDCSLTRMEVR